MKLVILMYLRADTDCVDRLLSESRVPVYSRLEMEGIAKAAGANDKVLVTVFLDGGIDSLSLLAPTTDPRYRQLRPGLALPLGAGTEFTEDARLRWHPAAASLDAPAWAPRGADDVSLRLVLLHMIHEYARHLGHADLLRERIDGRIGQ